MSPADKKARAALKRRQHLATIETEDDRDERLQDHRAYNATKRGRQHAALNPEQEEGVHVAREDLPPGAGMTNRSAFTTCSFSIMDW